MQLRANRSYLIDVEPPPLEQSVDNPQIQNPWKIHSSAIRLCAVRQC